MSKIIDRIRDDLHNAMSLEVEYRRDPHNFLSDINIEDILAIKNVCRSIISMYPSLDVKPDNATDEQTISLVRKYISQEKERELYKQKYLTQKDVENISHDNLRKLVNSKIAELGDKLTSLNIKYAEVYLPTQLTEEQIKDWLKQNVDFSKLKNKKQAIGIIMKKFQGQVDGKLVNKVIDEL